MTHRHPAQHRFVSNEMNECATPLSTTKSWFMTLLAKKGWPKFPVSIENTSIDK